MNWQLVIIYCPHFAAEVGHALADTLLVCENQPHAGVIAHKLQTFGGEMEIEWHIGGSRLHDGQRVDHHQLGTVDHHTDGFLRLHLIFTNKVCRYAVGHFVYLAVGHPAVTEDNGSSIGRGCRLSTEQAHQCVALVEIKSLATAEFYQCCLGFLGHQGQLAYWPLGHRRHIRDDGLEGVGNLSHLLFAIERCVVGEGQPKRSLPFRTDGDGYLTECLFLNLDGLDIPFGVGCPQIIDRIVLESHHRLEQRRTEFALR